MGAADLVPGVSGGTVAFVCGIYDRLINGIKSFDLTTLRLVLRGRFKEVFDRVPVPFFIALGLGLLTAIFSLSHALSGLFKSHPVQLWSFFFGLVFGSILLLARETWRWRLTDWAAFIIAAVATWWLVGLEAIQTPADPALPLLRRRHRHLRDDPARHLRFLPARDHGQVSPGLGSGESSRLRRPGHLHQRHCRRHPLVRARRQLAAAHLAPCDPRGPDRHHAGALRTVWPWKEVVSTRLNSKGEVVPLVQHNVLPATAADLGMALLLACSAPWSWSESVPARLLGQ
jgi:putative membrane protein